MQVLFTPAAQQSLQEIYDYIAEDNPGKAKEFIQHLKKQCGVLAENPRMGRARPELQETLRSFPVSPYLIFYKALKESLLIVNIIHGARDIEALF
jgi:toxin ParE1/3/4